jgi:hypothetical protein
MPAPTRWRRALAFVPLDLALHLVEHCITAAKISLYAPLREDYAARHHRQLGTSRSDGERALFLSDSSTRASLMLGR